MHANRNYDKNCSETLGTASSACIAISSGGPILCLWYGFGACSRSPETRQRHLVIRWRWEYVDEFQSAQHPARRNSQWLPCPRLSRRYTTSVQPRTRVEATKKVEKRVKISGQTQHPPQQGRDKTARSFLECKKVKCDPRRNNSRWPSQNFDHYWLMPWTEAVWGVKKTTKLINLTRRLKTAALTSTYTWRWDHFKAANPVKR